MSLILLRFVSTFLILNYEVVVFFFLLYIPVLFISKLGVTVTKNYYMKNLKTQINYTFLSKSDIKPMNKKGILIDLRNRT